MGEKGKLIDYYCVRGVCNTQRDWDLVTLVTLQNSELALFVSLAYCPDYRAVCL